MVNTTTWRCRQCFAHGITADFSSYAHMKSHLAGHGYGPWRCSGCNHIARRREAILAHHRASGENGEAAYTDPDLNNRINLEVSLCRLPHQGQWTGASAIPPPNDTARAAARAVATEHAQGPLDTTLMPLPVLVTKTVNAIMPMINHLSMTQNSQNRPLIQGWIELLQVRLDRVAESENFQQVALRLQRLGETVNLHHQILTTERERLALEATTRMVDELRREAERER